MLVLYSKTRGADERKVGRFSHDRAIGNKNVVRAHLIHSTQHIHVAKLFGNRTSLLGQESNGHITLRGFEEQLNVLFRRIAIKVKGRGFALSGIALGDF